MCMMIGRAQVKVTRIFATKHAGKDVLVYEAAIMTPESNAMVLPIPIRAGSGPIELVDLSAFPQMFAEIALYYNGPVEPADAWGRPEAPPQKLEVFTVGAFKASIVPSLDQLGQLDDRFHIQPGFRELLAERYGDWAFVVYQLAPGNHILHPFGVAFESRFQEQLFFPTLHVHDGAHAAAKAGFAHSLYAQGASLEVRQLPFNDQLPRSPRQSWGDPPPPVMAHPWAPPPPPRPVLPMPEVPGFVDLRRPLDSMSRFGVHPNTDMYVKLQA